jgi:radical SAM superfamily enzyme YgiQ (UPF0313 family)
MKITLVYPETYEFARVPFQVPYGFGVLIATVSSTRAQIDIVDFYFDRSLVLPLRVYDSWYRNDVLEEPLQEAFRAFASRVDADMIAFSCLSNTNLIRALATAKYLKRERPALWNVFGGCSLRNFANDIVANREYVDCAFVGGSEFEFVKFIDARTSGDDEWSDVGNLVYRRDGGVRVNATAPYSMDSRACPDYDYYYARMKTIEAMQYMTSDGCINKCNFCGLADNPLRVRSVGKVESDIAHLKRKYAPRLFEFQDDNLFCSKKRTMQLLDVFRRQDIRWYALISPNVLDDEIVAGIASSGCVGVQLGMESASARLLEEMNKKVDCDRLAAHMHRMADAGVKVILNMLVGTPFERDADTETNVRFILQNKDYIDRVNVNRFVLDLNSRWARDARVRDYCTDRMVSRDFSSIGIDNERTYDHYREVFEVHGVRYA